jgi:CTP synthase
LLGNKQIRFRIGKTPIGKNTILERHRHRYEVSPDFVHYLEDSGLSITGHHVRFDDVKLVEFIELPKHPFFVATQAHPEFKSVLEDPAPLFFGFVDACDRKKRGKS